MALAANVPAPSIALPEESCRENQAKMSVKIDADANPWLCVLAVPDDLRALGRNGDGDPNRLLTEGLRVDVPHGQYRSTRSEADRVARLGNRGVGVSLPGSAARTVAVDALTRVAARGETVALPRREADLAQQIEQFCDYLVGRSDIIPADIRTTLANGETSPDSIYDEVFRRAAAELGQRWCDDRASFLDVTLGMGKLQALLRRYGQSFDAFDSARVSKPSALFAVVPGEEHRFGLCMAADYFRRAGWDVEVLDHCGTEGLCRAAAERGPDLIGLSAGSRRMLSSLARVVAALRTSIPKSLICVGGQLTSQEPFLVERMGVDSVVSDVASDAVLLKKLVRRDENVGVG